MTDTNGAETTPGPPPILTEDVVRLVFLPYSRAPHKIPENAERAWSEGDVLASARSLIVHLNGALTRMGFNINAEPISSDQLTNALTQTIETSQLSPRGIAAEIINVLRQYRVVFDD